MVEREVKLNATLSQRRYQFVVKRKARLVPCALPIGLNPWPRDGEPVSIDAQLADQFDIFLPPEIMLASVVSVACIRNFSLRVTEGVPDRWAFAIAGMGAFYLK